MKNIFDREALLERIGGDEALANELVELFLEDVPVRLDLIEEARNAGDMKTIVREAHTIKGSSGNISADDMKEAALQLELAGKEENQEKISLLIKSLKESFKDFQQALADMDT